MSRDTGIPYISIYDSLANEKRNRDLRAGEAFRICKFLDISPSVLIENPMNSTEKKEVM